MRNRPLIPGGEKTILISKQAFADKAMQSFAELRADGIVGESDCEMIAKLLGTLTYNLFDDEEDEADDE
ncbi:MAG: hypothetical protein J6Y48_14915 [Clostridia bacterium]|nr:hypothetical protein [Clostridia bacterium]